MNNGRQIQSVRSLNAIERLNIPGVSSNPEPRLDDLYLMYDLNQGGMAGRQEWCTWNSGTVDISSGNVEVSFEGYTPNSGFDDFEVELTNRVHTFGIYFSLNTAASIEVIGRWEFGPSNQNFWSVQNASETVPVNETWFAPLRYGVGLQLLGGGATDTVTIFGHTLKVPEGVEVPRIWP